jgi:hypothetical protein
MAKTKVLNPIIGKFNPKVKGHTRGPNAVPPGPAFASKSRTSGGKIAPKDHRSKKAYTGTLAGVGRGNIGGVPVVYRQGPQGPRGFGGSTKLPRRGSISSGAVEFKPAPRPGLMTRVGQAIRRRAAALGF